MQLNRNDEDGSLWATQIGALKTQLNLTEIAKEIRANQTPEAEMEEEVLSHLDASLTEEEKAMIMEQVRSELSSLTD